MKFLKCLPVMLLAMLGMGMAAAQSLGGHADWIKLPQFGASGKNFQSDRAAERQPRQRRFVIPTNGNVYQKSERPQQLGQQGQPGQAAQKTSRMSRAERRALRRQINEANQGIYQNRRNRTPAP